MIEQIKNLTALNTGTISIPVDLATSAPSLLNNQYRVTGAVTLIGNLNIAPSGTPSTNSVVVIDNEALITAAAGVGDYIIFGQTIPYTIALKNFRAICIYNGSAWVVYILVDRSDKIPFAELATLSSANILVGNSSGVPVSVAVSGDITMSNTGTVTIGNAKVLDPMISAMDAAKLTGTVAAARLAAKSLASTKLSDVVLINSKYSDTGTTAVTTSETLYTYTVPGATFTNDGEGIEVIAYGSFAATANVKSVVAKFGTNTYAANSVTTSPNGVEFKIEFQVLRSGATSAVGFGEMTVGAIDQGVALSKGGITWANATDVTIVGTNGTAAANDIVLSLVIVKQIR